MSVARVVQELTQQIAASKQDKAPQDVELMRFSLSALHVLHQAAEAFLVNFIILILLLILLDREFFRAYLYFGRRSFTLAAESRSFT